MRLSYISVLMFIFLLFNVYADPDLGIDPIDPDPGIDPIDPPVSSGGSFLPVMPADFTNILSAGMIGISIGILLAALAYMVGNFFMFPQMIGWSKNQLWESLYTMVLVSTILVLSVVIHLFPFGVPEAIAMNSQVSFPQKAAISLDNVINGNIDLADLTSEQKEEIEESGLISTENIGVKRLFFLSYSHQIFLNVVYAIVTPDLILGPAVAMGSSVIGQNTEATTGEQSTEGQVAIPEVGLNLKGNILTGFKKLMGLSGTISNYLLTLLLILYSQMAALIFISGAGTFIFMLGVFFRCISFTRKMGSTLIALFIVLYFVYPAFVLFVYSDSTYGNMIEEFSGLYVADKWFESMEGMDPQGIVLISPLGVNQIDKNNLKDDEFVMGFYSRIFPEYNYTIMLEDKVVCEGNASITEIVSCDLKDSLDKIAISNSNSVKRQDLNVFDVSEFKNEIKPLNYTILLESRSDYCLLDKYISDIDVIRCEPGYEMREISYYPKKGKPTTESNTLYTGEPNPLNVPVYVVTECRTDSCHQYFSRVSVIMENQIRSEISGFLLGPLIDELQSTDISQTVEDVGVLTVKTGVIGFATWAGGPVGGKVGTLTATYMFKNDLSAFFYDELTCDPFITDVAKNYFRGQDSGPTVSESSFEHIAGLSGWFKRIQERLTDIPILSKFVTYYGESDYTSCSNTLGFYDSGQLTAWTTQLFGDWNLKWKNMNMTVILAPIVYVFISFIYTLIFCVTFFKSLSGSIGGDASLLGLGKLL
jgi:hypothetical protein